MNEILQTDTLSNENETPVCVLPRVNAQPFFHGSLFSGIGGFDLAAEWAGWQNAFHCEWNEFGQKILKHYWPKAISYGDITKTDFTIHRGTIDVLTGGFPCQPYSLAGKRKGKEDERHLWPEMLRAIREIAPRYIVGETFMAYLIGTGDWFSTRCKLTWKMKGTKYSRLYFQLVPLVRHIGEKEYGLWPTPTSVQRDHPERVNGLLEKGASTMMSRKNGENRPNSVLDMAMFLGMIPTPTTRDYKGARSKEALKKAGRNETNSLPDFFSQPGISSQLNPRFVEEMMGFPIGWTELKHLETR
jgi:C-5 cytosine-specific DNA methylase